MAFSSDGERIVSGGWYKTLKVWDAQGGQLVFTLEGPYITEFTYKTKNGSLRYAMQRR